MRKLLRKLKKNSNLSRKNFIFAHGNGKNYYIYRGLYRGFERQSPEKVGEIFNF